MSTTPLTTSRPKAFLSEYLEEAYQEATAARRKVINRAVLFAAYLIHEKLPTANSITVDMSERRPALIGVHADLLDLWGAHEDTASSPFHQGDVDEVEGILHDAVTFGRTKDLLGKAVFRRTTGLYRLALPDTHE